MVSHDLRGRSSRQRRWSKFPSHLSNQARLTRQIDNGAAPRLRVNLVRQNSVDSSRRRPGRPTPSIVIRFYSCFRIFPSLSVDKKPAAEVFDSQTVPFKAELQFCELGLVV